jgi:hypothetical protein
MPLLPFAGAPTKPKGSNTQVQYNNSGVFAGASGLTYNNSTNVPTATNGLIIPKIYPASDSTTALQINKADGTTNILNVDTTNKRVGIGLTNPGSLLEVKGDGVTFISQWTNSSGAAIQRIGTAGGLILGAVGSDIDGNAWERIVIKIATDNGLAIRGIASQTGDYFQIISPTAAANIPDLLKFNSNGQMGIGSTTLGTNAKLQVNPNNTADNLATVQMNTTVATNKGLVVQGFTSQTANLQEWQKSDGTIYAGITSGGLINPNVGIVFNATSANYIQNSIYCGAINSGAVNNSFQFIVAGAGSGLANTNGPYFGARGLTFNGVSTQRGNIFFSAGYPSAPAQGESQIRFIGGSPEAVSGFFDKNGGFSLGYAVTIAPPAGGAIFSSKVGIGTTAPSTLLHVGLAGTTLGTIGVAGNTSGLVTIQPAAAAGTWTLTVPTSAGTSGQMLKTDGTGVTSWAGVNTATGRATAQSGANANILTYTVGGSDASFLISANILITAFTAGTISMTCAYTDESGTTRTLTLNFSGIGGTLATTAGAAGAFEGIPLHIRAQASTTIVFATTVSVFTGTYNAESQITAI